MLHPGPFIALAAVAQSVPSPASPAGGQAPLPKVRINPTKRTLRFVVPLTDNGIYLGDITLAVAPDDALSVESGRLFQMLDPILKPEVLTRLKSAVAGRSAITAAELSGEQIGLAYDSDNLALAILIPALARKRESVSLRASAADVAPTLDPAPFSAFLNFRSSLDFVERGQDPGVTAPVSLVDGAVRALGVVAEGEAYLSLRKDDPFFRRTGTRLVYDDLGDLVRFTAGDVPLFARGFQGTASVAGISASRSYSTLEPGEEFRSTGAQSFTLFAPSTVETIVNGQSVEHRVLQPGTYTLRDFPLAEGSNDVKLLIDDPTGKRRTIDFSVYSDLQLLGPGATEFSAFAGVYSEPGTNGIDYSRKWAASGFVRKGLSQQLTAGFNIQADSEAQQVGAEALVGSSLGLVGVELGASRRQDGGQGYAAALTFEKFVQGDSAEGQSIRASVEYRSAGFATPGSLTDKEPLALQASAGYAMTFSLDTYVSLDGQYTRDRVLDQSRYSARLSGGIRLGRSLSVIGAAEFDHTSSAHGAVLRIGMRKRFGTASSAQADIDSRGVARGSIQTQGGSGIGAWSASGDVSRDDGVTTLNAAANYSGNRGEFGIAQFAGYDGSSNRVSDIRTSVRAGTSISFADGVFAIGRPIQQAFLIADTHRTLDGKPVTVDPQGRSEQARSGALGAALDGNLTAYAPRTLIYNVPDAPPGYDLGAGNVQIRPPYKAGYHLRIGSDYHLLVIGRLLARDGTPVALLAGTARDLGAPRHPPVVTFTSRTGKFAAQGLRPGKWRIEMPTDGGPTIYEIDIHDDPSGTVRVGDVRPLK